MATNALCEPERRRRSLLFDSSAQQRRRSSNGSSLNSSSLNSSSNSYKNFFVALRPRRLDLPPRINQTHEFVSAQVKENLARSFLNLEDLRIGGPRIPFSNTSKRFKHFLRLGRSDLVSESCGIDIVGDTSSLPLLRTYSFSTCPVGQKSNLYQSSRLSVPTTKADRTPINYLKIANQLDESRHILPISLSSIGENNSPVFLGLKSGRRKSLNSGPQSLYNYSKPHKPQQYNPVANNRLNTLLNAPKEFRGRNDIYSFPPFRQQPPPHVGMPKTREYNSNPKINNYSRPNRSVDSTNDQLLPTALRLLRGQQGVNDVSRPYAKGYYIRNKPYSTDGTTQAVDPGCCSSVENSIENSHPNALKVDVGTHYCDDNSSIGNVLRNINFKNHMPRLPLYNNNPQTDYQTSRNIPSVVGTGPSSFDMGSSFPKPIPMKRNNPTPATTTPDNWSQRGYQGNSSLTDTSKPVLMTTNKPSAVATERISTNWPSSDCRGSDTHTDLSRSNPAGNSPDRTPKNGLPKASRGSYRHMESSKPFSMINNVINTFPDLDQKSGSQSDDDKRSSQWKAETRNSRPDKSPKTKNITNIPRLNLNRVHTPPAKKKEYEWWSNDICQVDQDGTNNAGPASQMPLKTLCNTAQVVTLPRKDARTAYGLLDRGINGSNYINTVQESYHIIDEADSPHTVQPLLSGSTEPTDKNYIESSCLEEEASQTSCDGPLYGKKNLKSPDFCPTTDANIPSWEQRADYCKMSQELSWTPSSAGSEQNGLDEHQQNKFNPHASAIKGQRNCLSPIMSSADYWMQPNSVRIGSTIIESTNYCNLSPSCSSQEAYNQEDIVLSGASSPIIKGEYNGTSDHQTRSTVGSKPYLSNSVTFTPARISSPDEERFSVITDQTLLVNDIKPFGSNSINGLKPSRTLPSSEGEPFREFPKQIIPAAEWEHCESNAQMTQSFIPSGISPKETPSVTSVITNKTIPVMKWQVRESTNLYPNSVMAPMLAPRLMPSAEREDSIMSNETATELPKQIIVPAIDTEDLPLDVNTAESFKPRNVLPSSGEEEFREKPDPTTGSSERFESMIENNEVGYSQDVQLAENGLSWKQSAGVWLNSHNTEELWLPITRNSPIIFAAAAVGDGIGKSVSLCVGVEADGEVNKLLLVKPSEKWLNEMRQSVCSVGESSVEDVKATSNCEIQPKKKYREAITECVCWKKKSERRKSKKLGNRRRRSSAHRESISIVDVVVATSSELVRSEQELTISHKKNSD